MSSRGQANSSRSKKPRDKQSSQTRDHSQDSIKSEVEPVKSRPRSREDGKKKEISRSKTNKSPRKVRGNKDFTTIEKSSSSRNLSGRKDDKKERGDNLAHDKSKEANKSPVHGMHCKFLMVDL